MNQRKVIGAVFVIVLNLVPFVASGEPDKTAFSLEEAFSYAVNNDAKLAALQAVGSASGGQIRLGRWENPELRLGIEDQANGDDGYQVAVRFRLNNPWQNKAAIRRQDALSELARLRVAEFGWYLELEVRQLYYQARYKQERASFLQENAQVQRAVVEYIQSLPSGSYKGSDLIDAKVDYVDEQMRADAELREARAAKAALFSRIAFAGGRDLFLSTPFQSISGNLANINRENGTNDALQMRKELSVIGQELEVARASVDFEAAVDKAWFSFVQPMYQLTDHSLGNDEDFGLNVGITIPVFESNKLERLRRRDELRAIEMERDAIVKRIQAEVNTALADVQFFSQTADQKNDLVEEILKEFSDSLEEGGADEESLVRIIDVVDEARMKASILQVKQAKLDAAYEAQEALLRLEAALGRRLVP